MKPLWSVINETDRSPSVSPPFLRPGLAAVSFWVEMLWAVDFCGGRDHFNVWPSSPHAFHCKGIIGAHLDGPVGSPSHCFRELLLGSTPQDDHSSWDCVMTLLQQICGHGDPWLSTSVCLGAFAVLWMATLGEGVTDMTARTLRAAAGLEGKHHWGLILSSSARVTQLTYETVIGVRYPELVKREQGHWSFGRFLPGEALIMGGFIPILWDVPKSNLCAVEDVGFFFLFFFSSLAERAITAVPVTAFHKKPL